MPVGSSGVSNFALTTLAVALGVSAGAGLSGGGTTVLYTGIAPSFTASVTTGAAPLAVFFDGTGTVSPTTSSPWRDLLYGFDSGDATSGNYTYGTRAGQSKRKVLGGPTAGHVYETPGTYTATMYVFDGSNYVGRTQTITVQDPDVVFAGTNTICCSTTGNFTGAPAGASLQTVANLAAAMAFFATDKRVLLQHADTWSIGAATSLTGTKDRFVLSSFGGGRALITLTAGVALIRIAASTVSRFQIYGIDVNGSSNAASYVVLGNTALTATGVHLHDVYGYDISSLYTTAGTHLTVNLSISKCRVERVKGGGGYTGIFAQCQNLVLVDTLIDNATAAEHNVRFQYVGKGYIGGLEATNPATNKNALTLRPPPWASSGVNGLGNNIYTEYVTIADSEFSSNTPYCVTASPQASNADERIRYCIFERNHTYALGSTFANGLAISGASIISRNNVYNLTGGAAYSNGVFIIANSTFTSDSNESWNDTVYSGSAHTGTTGFGATSGAASNSKLKNMLMYTPLATTAEVIGSTAVATTTGTGNSTNANAKTLNPLFITPLTGIAGFALDVGSPYATSALLDKNYSDALDKIRVSNGGALMLASNSTSAWDLFGP